LARGSFYLVYVLDEDLEAILRVRSNYPRSEVEDQVHVRRTEMLQVLNSALVIGQG